MISVFFPYYQCGDADRQKEIDLCLRQNSDNPHIDKLIVVIDDGCDVPFISNNMTVLHVEKRMTYKYWVELTSQYCSHGITVLCNSDIYFDDSIKKLKEALAKPKSFLALSRWELLSGETEKHPNPHWSQDTWAMNVGEEISKSFLHQLEFPMGVPRCDNKVAYLFAVHGWSIHNPVDFVKSIHAHETQMRTYNKKIDERIMGGVAYVHPGESVEAPAALDFDVWIRESGSKINTVKINKTLEKWRKEAAQEALPHTLTTLALEQVRQVKASELLEAIRSGKCTEGQNPNYKIIEYSNRVYLYNLYAHQNRISVDHQAYLNNKEYYNVVGFIPPVLSSYVSEIGLKPTGPSDINFWQYPCATEKQAYENHTNITPGEHVDISNKIVNLYIPLPWATYVDKKQFPESYLLRVKSVISQYEDIAKTNGYTLKVHSVCQHIHWARMLEKAEWLGITDFYLSHKDSKSEAIQQEIGTTLNLHGWTLIAVNYEAPERSEGMERKPMAERNLLASFIGAHMKHYRDDSRIKLFEAAKACGRDDVFVDLGNEWHFNKVVYEEQVLNREIAAHHIDEHHERTFRYNTILSDSKFSLCPEGAGPNTLRFWESIAVGSIPVIFSDDLAIFNDTSIGQDLLDNVVVWEGDISSDLFDSLGEIDEEEIIRKSQNLIALYPEVAKLIITNSSIFGNIIVNTLEIKDTNKGNTQKLSLLYVGASVTAQKNGFRLELNKLFTSNGREIKEKVLATGATGSIFGLCNLSTLNEDNFDIGFYEYSTGDLNIGLTPIDKIYETVKLSLKILSNKCRKVYVIHNYRSDFEGQKGDVVRALYNKAANEIGIQILEIYKDVEEYKKSYTGNWVEMYRDNVHTGEKGSVFVASKIYESLTKQEELNGNESKIFTVDSAPSIYGLNAPNTKQQLYTYPSSGQKFEYISLKKGQKLLFEMKGRLLGVIPIVGPTSGWLRLTIDNKKKLSYSLFDRHCHYTRVQPRFVEYESDEFVKCKIEATDQTVDISVCAKPHSLHKNEREISLSGFMGENLELKNIRIES